MSTLKKIAVEAFGMLSNAYGDAAISKKNRNWMKRVKVTIIGSETISKRFKDMAMELADQCTTIMSNESSGFQNSVFLLR